MLKLLIFAAAFALAADAAHAAPAVAAVASFLTPVLGATIAGFVANLVVGTGLSILSAALAPKPDRPKVEAEVSLKSGDDLPLSFCVGRYATGGQRKYVKSWGKNTRFITQVIEYSSLPQGLDGMWVNDEAADFVTGRRGTVAPLNPFGVKDIVEHDASSIPAGYIDIGTPLNNYRDDADTTDPRIWVKIYNGTQTSADPLLVEIGDGDPDYPWGADHIGTGKSYVVITVQYDSDTLTSYPNFAFEPRPLPLYDIRKDSTNGGSGAHRWNDPNTWQPTENPAVIAYNIIRGIYYGNEWVFGGKNISAWRLPSAEWIAAANECDDTVNLNGGGTEPRYRVGMEVRCDMLPLDVLDEIRRGANMRFAEVGGRIKPVVGLPAGVALSITDDDVIVTEGQSFQPFYPVAETFNAISANDPAPAEKWATKDAPQYIDAEATADDGGRYLPASISYAAVPYWRQVQRLNRAQMRDYRRMRRHQFYLPPEAYGLEPGVDVIAWSSTRNGYENKKFLVESVAKTPGMNMLVTLREVNPADYDWSSSFESSVTITVPKNVLPPAQDIDGFTAIPVIIEDEANYSRRAAIRVSCDGDEAGVTNIQIQARVVGKDITIDVPRNYSPPYRWHLQNVLPDTAYQVRARLISGILPKSLWSAWLDVTTFDVKFSWDDFENGLREDIEDAMADAAQARQDLIAVDAKAQAVRDDHDALVSGFVGSLMDLDAADQGIQQRMDLLELSVSNTSYIRTTDGDSGIGQWAGMTGATAPATSASVPPGQTGTSIQIAAPGAYEPPYYSGASINGTVFRLRGWISVDAGETARVAVIGSTQGNGPGGQTVLAQSDPITGGWQQVDLQFTVGVDTDEWAPAVLLTGGTARFWRVRLEDYSAAASLEASIAANAQAIVDEESARVAAINTLAASSAAADATLTTGITDIKGLKVNNLSGTALGTLLTQLNVNAGGTSATITSQGSAIADLEGNASAGYLIKAQAGGSVSLLDLIAADGSAGSVSVAKIDADEILLSGTVGADKLVIYDPDNLVPDNQFQSEEAWGLPFGPYLRANSGPSLNSIGSIFYDHSKATGSGWQGWVTSRRFSTEGNTEYHVEFRVVTGSANCNFWYRFVFIDENGDRITTTPIHAAAIITGNKKFTTVITTPSNCQMGQVELNIDRDASTGNARFGDSVVRAKREGSVLITPGGITAPLITAETMRALNGQFVTLDSANISVGNGEIVTAHIKNLAVDRLKLADGAVTTEEYSYSSGGIRVAHGTNWETIQTLSYTPGRTGPQSIEVDLDWDDGGDFDLSIYRVQSGVWTEIYFRAIPGPKLIIINPGLVIDKANITGAVTYHLRARTYNQDRVFRRRFMRVLNAHK
ncbi:hypothetical protein [Paracoccus homiensis]|uniref:Putative phage tail protein n=1 Tax=Paracoccus homiensis TaxID=364199 RepID=A0A1I0J1R7_9RHOB|nr:hypothetical protein [Paracoccus homiensis]SEU03405.1 Putative phage tail protein [Paracoccus homiensis]